MQYFFVKTTSFDKGIPQLQSQWCVRMIQQMTLIDSNELFDESDKVFLKVMEDRFFPKRKGSFMLFRRLVLKLQSLVSWVFLLHWILIYFENVMY